MGCCMWESVFELLLLAIFFQFVIVRCLDLQCVPYVVYAYSDPLLETLEQSFLHWLYKLCLVVLRSDFSGSACVVSYSIYTHTQYCEMLILSNFPPLF